MKRFFYSLAALPFALGAGQVFAQEGQAPTFEIPSAFTSLDWTTLITSMSSVLISIIVPVISLAAGVFVIRWGWRTLKGSAR